MLIRTRLEEAQEAISNLLTELDRETRKGKSPEDVEGKVPSWMLDAEGKLATFLPQMDTSKGQIHFLNPPGIGDCAWQWSKLWKLAEDRDVTMWFQDDDVKRVQQYAELVGMKTAYCHVDIRECLDYPGDWAEEDLKDGGIFYCHANKHIESGRRIEEWMPWLPYKNPAPQLGRWEDKPHRNYITMHMGHATYAGQNWPARMWAKTVKDVQENMKTPVMPVGAYWDKAWCELVGQSVSFERLPCIDRHLRDALLAILHSKALIAVDSGLAILAKYLGVPVLQAYPAWLVDETPTKRNPNGTHMPGAWETDTHELSSWCLLDEVLDKSEERGYRGWLEKVL